MYSKFKTRGASKPFYSVLKLRDSLQLTDDEYLSSKVHLSSIFFASKEDPGKSFSIRKKFCCSLEVIIQEIY
jgi:hypothetical protein